MNVTAIALNKKQGYIKSSTLLLIAFATAFFPRILQTYKAPSAIILLHLVVVPLVCGVALLNTKTKDRQQIAITKDLLFGLLIFLTVGFTSALFNKAGVINVVADFVMFAEPFMLLLALISLPMSEKSSEQFRSWVIGFNFFHILLALFQWLVLGQVSDDMQGVFYHSGSGHVVGSAVSLSFSLYYFISAKNRALWFRLLVIAASLVHLVISDAKQVIITFLVGFGILALSKTNNPVKTLIYLIGLALFCVGFYWAIFNVPELAAFKAWNRPELYGPDGDVPQFKSLGIRIVLSHFHSAWNWVLGLGPGHTLGRLGCWFLRDYSYILRPLGATTSTVPDEVWAIALNHYLGPLKGTSLFAPMFGWVAIWGDFGFFGLFTYLYLCSIVWRRVCVDDFSKLMMLTVLVHGFMFTQMEEPGFMLTIACFIGLRWQEKQVKAKASQLSAYLAQLHSYRSATEES